MFIKSYLILITTKHLANQLPPRILRDCAEELSTLLAHLFNSLLRSGVMPTLWKCANITPVHKGDKMELVENIDSSHCYQFLQNAYRELFSMLYVIIFSPTLLNGNMAL